MIIETKKKLKYIKDWKTRFPDLRDTFLAGTDFSGHDLAGGDFSGAILSGATFEGANLVKARFTNCILTDSNFTKANLKRADFRDAHLVRANLLESCLVGADFTGANLESVSYPFNCNGFLGVTHSMENIRDFLTLFQLLDGLDEELLEVIRPWFNEKLDLPDKKTT
ncbi:pentapeptide repeat-containing protein [Aliifodinibius sp. S!AR15-10]|uniref:pentapeptide repeat-containing protein n=1 Tax=Aliifodinibius sp. S!AR15-10 TaxID=2950437 RepID=UPI00285B0521|nr:pentapeptide repeat-containing protein [Aliifodinibius sp. S!AR15-10]MDR8390600.1 pentapeptide repeat-containing protein [Aliifodinibius sp. S!AR15-10]